MQEDKIQSGSPFYQGYIHFPTTNLVIESFSLIMQVLYKQLLTLPNTPYWQQKQEISIQDVINCNFILPSYSSSQMFRPKFELFCLDKCNKKPTISHEIDGLESTYQLISAGLGISILPEINIAKSNYNIIFRPCDFNIKCYTIAVWDENNHSKALKNLITLL